MNNLTKKMPNNTLQSDNPVITAPHIDKLSCVVDLVDPSLCGQAYSTMLEWVEAQTIEVVKVAVTGKYQLAVLLRYPQVEDQLIHGNSPHVLLQITSKKVSKRQLRIEYNPAHITEAAEEYLNVMFQEMIGMGLYDLLGHARFTRIDVAREILLRSIEDYLFSCSYFKYSHCHFGKDGKLGTVTFGKGSNQINVYDKAKELYGSAAEYGIIRVEARCRINMTLSQLAHFENPLARVKVHSLLCKNPPFGMGYWRAFQDSCRLRGVNNAVKNQPKDYQTQLKKVLSNLPVAWWRIEQDDWVLRWEEAFEDAGLTQIPSCPPPLILTYLAGAA